MAIIQITHEELKTLCPDAHAKIVAQNESDPSLTPIEDLILWLSPATDADGHLGDQVPQHPRHVLNLQDPEEGVNMSLVWDGDDWG